MSRKKFEKIAKALFTLAGQLSNTAYQNLQQARFITDRKRIEVELSHLRSYLSNIIDSMPSVIIGVDTDNQVTQWNAEAQRITGITADDAMGTSLVQSFPRLLSELQRIRKAIQTNQKQTNLKRPYQQEGATRYEDITIYPLIANGAMGAVIRIDDVTERAHLEEMMIQSEKMLSVGGLAAGMAHEINNPLAGIMQNDPKTVSEDGFEHDPVNEQLDCRHERIYPGRIPRLGIINAK